MSVADTENNAVLLNERINQRLNHDFITVFRRTVGVYSRNTEMHGARQCLIKLPSSIAIPLPNYVQYNIYSALYLSNNIKCNTDEENLHYRIFVFAMLCIHHGNGTGRH